MLSKDQLNAIKFTNLVQHTHWTIPMGIGSVKKQIIGNHKKGLHGFALSDHSLMSGALELYNLQKDKDFKAKNNIESLPIMLGVKLNFIDDLESKDLSRIFQLTLFAKNKEGFKTSLT